MLRQVVLAFIGILLLVSSVRAQEKQIKGTLEVGVQFSVLRETNGSFIFGPTSIEVDPRQVRSPMGGGGRTVYNFNRFWSVEAEINVFPEQNVFAQHADFVCCGVGKVIDGRIVEGLAGTKIGARLRRIGVFGKLRPGFLKFDRTLGECTRVSVGLLCKFDKPRTDFVLDVGGALETYVSPRWFLRVDLSDIIQFFPGLNPDLIRQGLPFEPSAIRAQKYHNFQFSTGAGFRF